MLPGMCHKSCVMCPFSFYKLYWKPIYLLKSVDSSINKQKGLKTKYAQMILIPPLITLQCTQFYYNTLLINALWYNVMGSTALKSGLNKIKVGC